MGKKLMRFFFFCIIAYALVQFLIGFALAAEVPDEVICESSEVCDTVVEEASTVSRIPTKSVLGGYDLSTPLGFELWVRTIVWLNVGILVCGAWAIAAFRLGKRFNSYLDKKSECDTYPREDN